MNKLISYKYWKMYTASSFICMLCIPYILKAVLLLIRKIPLSILGNAVIDICVLVIAVMLGGLAVVSFKSKKNSSQVDYKKVLEVFVVDGIMLVCLGNLGTYGIKCITGLINIYPMFAYIIMFSMVILSGVYVLLLQNYIYIMLVHLQGQYETAATKIIIRYMRKNKVLFFKTIVVVLILSFGNSALEELVSLITISKTGSFITNASYYMLEALMMGGIICWYITETDKFLEEYIASIEYEGSAICTISKKKRVFLISLLVLAIGGFVIQSINKPFKTSPQRQIEELVAKGTILAELEDEEYALIYYREADNYIQALQAFLEDDEKRLESYAEKYQDISFYRDLYLTRVPDVPFLEDIILHGKAEKEDIFYLLEKYNRQAELSEEELAFQKECIDVCIAQNYLYGNYERFRKKDLRQSRIEAIVQEYGGRMSQADVLELMIKAKQCGKVSRGLLSEANELANSNPENFMCQFAAMAIAEEYIRQGGNDYSDVMEIIDRYNEGIDDNYTEPVELAQEKTYVGRLLIDIGKISDGCKVLEEAYSYEALEETAYYLLFCYNTQNEGEKLLTLVKDLDSKGIVSRETIFYGAVGNLYIGDVMASLEYGIKLVDRVTDMTNTDKEKDMEYLNGYLGYLRIDNEYVRDIWGEAVIQEFSEEEWNYIKTSPFLEAAISAVDNIYNKGDYDNALIQLELMDDMVPGLSKVKYYQGAAYYALEEYEKAIEVLEHCLKIDASNIQAAYTLAKGYEKMEQYDLVLEQCENILQQLNQKQDVIDSYGVYEETKKMYENLQQKAGCADD